MACPPWVCMKCPMDHGGYYDFFDADDDDYE
jgi:hypothetical protein